MLPAKVGPLLIMVYFSVRFFELGFAMANLFEVADDEDLKKKPCCYFLFGVPESENLMLDTKPTIFYDDEKNDILIGTVPDQDAFGYFGYLKKMILTLHNIKMMKMGRMPFHGALVSLDIRGKGDVTVLVMGDTGAGKSETLEALRTLGNNEVDDIAIIADDMGSLSIAKTAASLATAQKPGLRAPG